MYNFDEIKIELKKMLSPERFEHSLGTAEMAKILAQKFSLDENKAEFTGLIHDCGKNIPVEKMLEIIKDNNLQVDESELASKKTLHAPVGAYIAENKFGIKDKEILLAIRFHTIGSVNMTDFEKIIYLADKIELKTRESEYREKIADTLEKTNNLDEAMLVSYELTIKSLADRELPISYLTIDIYNKLLNKLNKIL